MKTKAETIEAIRAWSVAKALRAAAAALEAGAAPDLQKIVPMSVTYDGTEVLSTLSEAAEHAQEYIEPGYDEVSADVEDVSWGVYIAVEFAKVLPNGEPCLVLVWPNTGRRAVPPTP